MKRKISATPILFAIAILLVSSCRKDNSSSDESISAEDSGNVTSALNSSTDDAANAVGGITSLSGKTDGALAICGYTIDSTQKSSGIITINFDGTPCNNNSKTGSIVATLENYSGGTRWKDAGAVLKLEFQNVQVTKISNGKSLTINGNHYITNTTGGVAWKVLQGLATSTVTHKHVADNFTVTFDDGSQRVWSVRRSRSFSVNGQAITVTVTGDTTVNGQANVEAWGTNRRGNTFTTAITSAIASNNTCGYYKPVTGELNHLVSNKSMNVLFGVDASGTQASGACPYGLKITYTGPNRTLTRVVAY